ncbi:hypothetical protein YB2330_006498 [Saitoella coloradoensis]
MPAVHSTPGNSTVERVVPVEEWDESKATRKEKEQVLKAALRVVQNLSSASTATNPGVPASLSFMAYGLQHAVEALRTLQPGVLPTPRPSPNLQVVDLVSPVVESSPPLAQASPGVCSSPLADPESREETRVKPSRQLSVHDSGRGTESPEPKRLHIEVNEGERTDKASLRSPRRPTFAQLTARPLPAFIKSPTSLKEHRASTRDSPISQAPFLPSTECASPVSVSCSSAQSAGQTDMDVDAMESPLTKLVLAKTRVTVRLSPPLQQTLSVSHGHWRTLATLPPPKTAQPVVENDLAKVAGAPEGTAPRDRLSPPMGQQPSVSKERGKVLVTPPLTATPQPVIQSTGMATRSVGAPQRVPTRESIGIDMLLCAADQTAPPALRPEYASAIVQALPNHSLPRYHLPQHSVPHPPRAGPQGMLQFHVPYPYPYPAPHTPVSRRPGHPSLSVTLPPHLLPPSFAPPALSSAVRRRTDSSTNSPRSAGSVSGSPQVGGFSFPEKKQYTAESWRQTKRHAKSLLPSYEWVPKPRQSPSTTQATRPPNMHKTETPKVKPVWPEVNMIVDDVDLWSPIERRRVNGQVQSRGDVDEALDLLERTYGQAEMQR